MKNKTAAKTLILASHAYFYLWQLQIDKMISFTISPCDDINMFVVPTYLTFNRFGKVAHTWWFLHITATRNRFINFISSWSRCGKSSRFCCKGGTTGCRDRFLSWAKKNIYLKTCWKQDVGATMELFLLYLFHKDTP